ncbi:MAG: DUF1232 domain-containing protein [Firmicutes bacterium]|nr:DUF1232 domain-containing protein [Bacillota bacterium]
MLLKDRSVSFWKKALVVFGIIYLLLPVDLIPPMIPVLGAFDDLILWAFILVYLGDDLERYMIPQEGGSAASKYRGRDVVDAQYSVNSEKEEENAGTKQ